MKHLRKFNESVDVDNIVQFDLTDVLRKNGAIGTQGVNEPQAVELLKSLGINPPNTESFRELIEYLRDNPTERQKLLNFTKKNPIKITELPDGTFHVDDGHHRATLLYHSGVKVVPAILSHKGQYSDKYKD